MTETTPNGGNEAEADDLALAVPGRYVAQELCPTLPKRVRQKLGQLTLYVSVDDLVTLGLIADEQRPAEETVDVWCRSTRRAEFDLYAKTLPLETLRGVVTGYDPARQVALATLVGLATDGNEYAALAVKKLRDRNTVGRSEGRRATWALTLTVAELLDLGATDAQAATTPAPSAPPRRSPADHRAHLALCVHEAAHAVAGVVLGADLRSAVVTSSRVSGNQGLTTFADRPHGTDVLIAYAGPFGQAKFLAGGRRPTQRALYALFDGGGRGDCGVLTASGGTHLGHDVIPVVNRAWPAVIRVAQRLDRTGEATHADVCAALGVTDGGGRTSAQLAGIRSGCRSVPALTKARTPAPA
ncbi:hypothetical protein EB75_18895 [Mycobacterium sp. ST-F2]|uniref:M50 family metallopeptidase n=1 Tax=Mycobacterium sp. ST-F2 TaxID=1490484 RepID=UPI00095A22A0|nr:M50 family metallopeptidase [Mycobacterium sp. ST-F2]OKH80878.1 hypothetical protein EB75_18895 [Mycobacterium sp. ST-F2]